MKLCSHREPCFSQAIEDFEAAALAMQKSLHSIVKLEPLDGFCEFRKLLTCNIQYAHD